MYSLFSKCNFLCFVKNKFACWLQKVYVLEVDKSCVIIGVVDVIETDKLQYVKGKVNDFLRLLSFGFKTFIA